MDPVEIEIEINEKAEFRDRRAYSGSGIGSTTKKQLDEVDTAGAFAKHMSSVDQHGSFFTKYTGFDSDQLQKGNAYIDVNPGKLEIERTNDVEFRNKRTHAVIGSSTGKKLNEGYSVAMLQKTADVVGKDIPFSNCSRSFTSEDDIHDCDKSSSSAEGFSTRHEGNTGYSPATSKKSADIWDKEAFLANCPRSFSSEDDGSNSAKSGSFAEKGNDYEGMDLEELEIKRIDKVEVRNKETHIVSNTRFSNRHEAYKGYSAATSHKAAEVGGSVIVISEDDDSDLDMGENSSPSTGKGNVYENTDLEKHGIKIIDRAEFTNKRTPFLLKIGSSTPDEWNTGCSAANSPKNAHVVYKEAFFANNPRSFSTEDGGNYFDQSSLFVEKENDTEDMDLEVPDIESIDETEFRDKRTHLVSKILASTKHDISKGYSAATSVKVPNIVDEEESVANCSKSSSAEDDDTYKGNCYEDMDAEKLIKGIGEAEFTKKKANFRPKIRSAAWQELDKGYTATATATSGENVNDVSRKICPSEKIDKKKEVVSVYPRRKLPGYDHASKKHNSCRDMVISSTGTGIDIDLGVASRTRSKITDVKKFPGSLYLNDLLSSTDDDGFDSSEDYFRRGNFYVSDSRESLCSYEKEHDVRNNIMGEVSQKRSEGCYKKRKTVVRVPKKRLLSSIYAEEEKSCSQPTFRRQEFSFGGRQFSQRNDIEANEENKVLKEKGSITPISGSVRRQEEAVCRGVVKEKFDTSNSDVQDNGKNEKVSVDSKIEKPTTSKKVRLEKLDAQKDCIGAEGLSRLLSENPSRGGIRRRKKAVSPTHSNYDDCGHGNYDVMKTFDTASSDIQNLNKNEKVLVDDKLEKQTIQKQVHSKQHDIYRELADYILERRPDENKIVEEAEQPPQTALPLKFRFEDEVPKQVEKTEHEKMMEALWSESELSLALTQLESVNCSEVEKEDECGFSEETQHAQCVRGKHTLVLQDDTGLRCLHCLHVELAPRDILPEWVENTCRKAKKKISSEADDLLNLDISPLASSMCKNADIHNNDEGTVWNLKPGLRGSMYDHQQEGFEFLWINIAGSINLAELKNSGPGEVGGCIISHAPGTGKTRLTIVFIETYLKIFPHCRPVIIAPASMLLTWEEEFRKWNVNFAFHNLSNLEFWGKQKTGDQLKIGTKHQRRVMSRMLKIYSWNKGGGVLGISYSLFEKLTGEKYIQEKKRKVEKRAVDGKNEDLRKILLEKPDLVFLDEGHTPRNERSNIWNALLKLQTRKRVILSGTPFQNNFAELFNTLRLVRPETADVLAQGKTFTEMIVSRGLPSRSKKSSSNPEATDSALEKLKTSMSPFVHIHKGTVLQESLPGLRDCVILLKPPALQKSLIETTGGNQSSFDFEHKVALISVHPYLLYGDLKKNPRIGIELGAIEASKLNPNEGVKTKFIVELVRLSKALNEKVLVFSQYIQPLELIEEQLKEIFKWDDGKQILRMEGKLGQKQRQLLINIFNDPLSEPKVMLASTRCCAEGISLVGASRVVLLDVLWNPSVERQAISRAYRIGQKKIVYTYHLMTSGTIEGEKYCRQAEKDRVSELVFCASSSESNKQKPLAPIIEDRILEEMVSHSNLKEMFEKIINQPKDADLIQNFGLTS